MKSKKKQKNSWNLNNTPGKQIKKKAYSRIKTDVTKIGLVCYHRAKVTKNIPMGQSQKI